MYSLLTQLNALNRLYPPSQQYRKSFKALEQLVLKVLTEKVLPDKDFGFYIKNCG
jgi:hypothetical protein